MSINLKSNLHICEYNVLHLRQKQDSVCESQVHNLYSNSMVALIFQHNTDNNPLVVVIPICAKLV